MSTRLVALLLVVAVGLAPTAIALQQAPADADLEAGIRQAQIGDFEKAVVTLDAAARRLAAEGGRSRDLARAYVYLSIAYLGLSQEQKAKAQFLEALKADTDMKFDESEFPPKIMEFFESAREEAVTEGVVPPSPPPSAETPSAAEPTAAAEPEEKGGGSKKLLLIGGGAAAVAVVALAAGGGGGNGGSAAPSGPVEQTIEASSMDVPKGIPDLRTAISQLNVTQSGTILEATLEFRIRHECVGDIRLTLRHPDGTPFTAEGPDFGGNTCFFEWDEALRVPFDGKPSAGIWVLEVADTREFDAGALASWGLRLRIRR